MANVLLIDDDEAAILSLTRALKHAGIDAAISATSKIAQAEQMLTNLNPEVVVLDLNLEARRGPESGFELLRNILAKSPTTRVIVLTGEKTAGNGIRALSIGAANFLSKPADIAHLRELIRDGIKQSEIRRNLEDLKTKSAAASNLVIGNSAACMRLKEEIRQASACDLPVLLLGETGVGKGLCAREIHRLSRRAIKRLVRYQPTFAGAEMIQSDLFGHAKGAFTGAADARRGLIREADEGTLFLDEIDQFPVAVQVALLGVLQDKSVRALGSDSECLVNFRLITATNAPIADRISAGAFRADLFHRIGHITIQIPPLRERLEDISELCGYILLRIDEEQRKTQNTFCVREVSGSAIKALMEYSWPGNVRELEAVVERSAYRAALDGRQSIEPRDLVLTRSSNSKIEKAGFAEQVENFKRSLIERALVDAHGNQARASQILGVDRSQMRRILARTGGE